MKKTALTTMAILSFMFASCKGEVEKPKLADALPADFEYVTDSFADLEVLRYHVPGFESLTLKQKELIYYMSQAAAEGRDILFDQNNRYNLAIRRTMEAIYTGYEGDKSSADFLELEIYMKRVWFSNGIHHHYGEDKFLPRFSPEFFAAQVKALPTKNIPTRDKQSVDQFVKELTPILFDPTIMAKKVNRTTTVDGKKIDIIATSANNYYGHGVTQAEVESFYNAMRDTTDLRPVAYGLNSRLVKEKGKLVEKVWKIDGIYTHALERIVGWLEKALTVAENDKQKDALSKLIEFYRTGSLKTYDDFSVAWVKDIDSRIDFVNGFTEVYGDPLGIKASWESIVNFKDIEATKRTQLISNNAQWFESNSPIDERFKKKEVKGVEAKVITAAYLGGDCFPPTAIGINLPNSSWIRKEHGSISVTIENIMNAYSAASAGSRFNDEFVWSDQERSLMKQFGSQTTSVNVDLHECLGHGSGQLLPNVDANAMGAYHSTIEETRADLFALYFIADNKMVELGIIPNGHAYKAEYYKFMMNGLMTQLTRIELGKNVEEDHMRNRQLIARWAYEHGRAANVVELKVRDGKTFMIINDYDKLRELFGKLLAEIQRIKSEGDIAAASKIIADYAVKVDPVLHKEILERYNTLNEKPYRGFINPVYTLVKDDAGVITDVRIDYKENYKEQMLRYAKDFSSLPTYND